MRLPARTKQQLRQEDARMFHERLWDSHLEQKRVFLAAIPDETPKQQQARLSGNLRRFWNERGYLFKTATDRQFNGLWVWIAPMPSTLHLGRKRSRQRHAREAA